MGAESQAHPLRDTKATPPCWKISSYVLWPGSTSLACCPHCPALHAGSFTSPNGSSPLVTEKKSASLCTDALQAPPNKLPAPRALPEHGSEIVTEPRACQNSPSRIRPYSPKPLPGWRKKLGSQGGTLSRCQERPAPRRAGFLFCSPLLGKHRNRGDFQRASGECAFRERSLKWFIFCWPRFRQTHKQTYFFCINKTVRLAS